MRSGQGMIKGSRRRWTSRSEETKRAGFEHQEMGFGVVIERRTPPFPGPDLECLCVVADQALDKWGRLRKFVVAQGFEREMLGWSKSSQVPGPRVLTITVWKVPPSRYCIYLPTLYLPTNLGS